MVELRWRQDSLVVVRVLCFDSQLEGSGFEPQYPAVYLWASLSKMPYLLT